MSASDDLAADEPSPLSPRSDDEEVVDDSDNDSDNDADDADKSKDEKSEEEVEVRIDFDGLVNRILSMEIPTRQYVSLVAGSEGTLFIAESIPNKPGVTLNRYKLEDRESVEFLSGVSGVASTDDGKKLLVSKTRNNYAIATTSRIC